MQPLRASNKKCSIFANGTMLTYVGQGKELRPNSTASSFNCHLLIGVRVEGFGSG